MERIPGLIREFSKERAQPQRDEAAEAIRAKRGEFFARRQDELSRREGQAAQADQLQRQRAEIERRVSALADSLAAIEESSWFRQLLARSRARELRAQVSAERAHADHLMEEERGLRDALDDPSWKRPELRNSPEWQEARRRLADFYAGQLHDWEAAGYSAEEVSRQFTEERLSSLSIEEYALLLRRFPPEMVTHVTRQGIRDHVGLISHTAGAGAFANGFKHMVEDGRLRSPIGIYLKEEDKKSAVGRFLGLDRAETRREVEELVATLTDPVYQGGPGSYADRNAIHFAAQEVADVYYGSERGNEIFVAYPSAHIASQYYRNGQLVEQGGGYWNDLWVWTNDEDGMAIDAALVFIPKDAPVSRETGSRYQLDAELNPRTNAEMVSAVESVVRTQDIPRLFEEAGFPILGSLAGQKWWEDNLLSRNQEAREKLEPFRQRLEDDGVTDPIIQRLILDYDNLLGWMAALEYEAKGMAVRPDQTVRGVTERALSNQGLLYRLAEDPVSSEEYWEHYFARVGHRPAKVIYYEGGDPTAALHAWKEGHGLSRLSSDKDLGFPERNVERTAEPAMLGFERFGSLVKEIADEYLAEVELPG